MTRPERLRAGEGREAPVFSFPSSFAHIYIERERRLCTRQPQDFAIQELDRTFFNIHTCICIFPCLASHTCFSFILFFKANVNAENVDPGSPNRSQRNNFLVIYQ